MTEDEHKHDSEPEQSATATPTMNSMWRRFWAGLYELILALSIPAMGLVIVFGAFQSDFAGSDVSPMTVDGKSDEGQLEIVFKVDSLNEAANSANVRIVALARPPLSDKIKHGDVTIEFTVTDGLPSRSGSDHIATLALDKASFSEGAGGVESQTIPAMLTMFRGGRPYPFDSYYTYLSVTAASTQLFPIPQLRTIVVKQIAGRTMTVSGVDEELSFRLARPRIQQYFVVISGIVFMAIVIGIALRIIQSPDAFSPVGQSVALAGFLLGIAGFRDLMGFPKLASFSVSEAIVVGIPLVILAYAFFRSSMLSSQNKAGS